MVTEHEILRYTHAINNGLSRVPAAKRALGFEISHPATLTENDQIQELIEVAEARSASVSAKNVSDQHNSVNHPSHYTQYKGLEIIDLAEQMNFNRGNAVKYIARAGFKNPDKELEDLEKAQWYLAREIERIKSE